MKSFDYFYEEILCPMCITISEFAWELAKHILEILLIIIYFVTIPLWIVPYAIIRHRRGRQ